MAPTDERGKTLFKSLCVLFKCPLEGGGVVGGMAWRCALWEGEEGEDGVGGIGSLRCQSTKVTLYYCLSLTNSLSAPVSFPHTVKTRAPCATHFFLSRPRKQCFYLVLNCSVDSLTWYMIAAHAWLSWVRRSTHC